ncbi:T9SS type A sorting domain-containing protein [Rhodocaloribacter litoris]|uniref:T9SS type A sorting domain-containing protein n=1 Tax=Rhodocaloribacter litoris TaxID=2558931 RepID=UPI001E5CDFFE|nr:T9SS type A sorting domain-containing protein [Rhodocaloribacter litoris]QXD16163.1 T9SS type A sorting domain-containing protein [Rhodocaloribacter litoris]
MYRPSVDESVDDVVVTYASGDGVYTTSEIEVMESISTGAALPVELAQFDALADGRDAVLVWRTLSETNNAGFWVEHAAARDTAFTPLAFVEGHGSTNEARTYRHRVEALPAGTHRFRLRQVDFDGSFAYSAEVSVSVGLPDGYLLSAAYPNPFNPETRLDLEVARRERVEVAVYDALGRRVQTLYAGELTPGRRQELVLSGTGLGSGLYLIRARGESFEVTRTALLVR